jgi:hypothetical protein
MMQVQTIERKIGNGKTSAVARSKEGGNQESNLEAAIGSDGACTRVPHRRNGFSSYDQY